MARINRTFSFGLLNSDGDYPFTAELGNDENVIIRDTVYDENDMGGTFVSIPLFEWNQLISFIQQEIKNQDGE